MNIERRITFAGVLALLALAPTANAQIAVSANDNKVMLDNGVVKAVSNATTGCFSGTAPR